MGNLNNQGSDGEVDESIVPALSPGWVAIPMTIVIGLISFFCFSLFFDASKSGETILTEEQVELITEFGKNTDAEREKITTHPEKHISSVPKSQSVSDMGFFGAIPVPPASSQEEAE